MSVLRSFLPFESNIGLSLLSACRSHLFEFVMGCLAAVDMPTGFMAGHDDGNLVVQIRVDLRQPVFQILVNCGLRNTERDLYFPDGFVRVKDILTDHHGSALDLISHFLSSVIVIDG
jgi:hypothetical protein